MYLVIISMFFRQACPSSPDVHVLREGRRMEGGGQSDRRSRDSVSLSCKFFQKSFNGPRSCPRMSASALVAGDAGGVAFYHFLRVDVVMLSSSSSGSRHVGSCAPSPRPKDGTGTSSFPHIGSQETAGKGLRAGAGKAAIANVFQRVATVWQINVILTDVSVCSTNKAEPCVPHFFSPLFLCI